jgi:hypothetical protein
MKGQNTKTKGTAFNLFLSLYVDNGSFIFESKKDMAKGAMILYHHMKWFGLLMHIGKGGSKSKTEALYIPPLGLKLQILTETRYLLTEQIKVMRDVQQKVHISWIFYHR